MASFRDGYDSRPAARHHDPYTRATETLSVNPPSRPASALRASSTGHTEPQRSHSTTSARNDPQYSYPLPPSRPVPSRPSSRSTRWAWPPRPICEDEPASLAREADSSHLLQHASKDDVQYRGTIDQDPLIQDAVENANLGERRFVRLSGIEPYNFSTAGPTPPTSEDEKARRAKRRPSKLNTDDKLDGPEFGRRATPPYAFKKPTNLNDTPLSSGRFLSPGAMTPPMTGSGRRWVSQPSSPRRAPEKLSLPGRKANDYFSASLASDEQAIYTDDGDTSAYVTPSQRQKTEQEPQPVMPALNIRTSIVDFAAPPRPPPHAKRLNLDARRHTDTSDTRPTSPALRVDRTRRPAATMAASALGGMAGSAVRSASAAPPIAPNLSARSRESSYSSSHGPSSVSGTNREASPLPRTPRYGSDMSRSSTTGSSPTSSKAGSTSGSRPASPSLRPKSTSQALPMTDADWGTFIAANAARRTQPPSRLASSVRQESTQDVPRADHGVPIFSTPTTSNLPYPEDDGPNLMPSERGYQYFPDVKPSRSQTQPAPPITTQRAPPLSTRPILQSRHSTAASPTEERMKAVEQRSIPFTTSSHSKRDHAALLKKGLSDCPRPEPVSGYDDWYTVIGAPNVDLCPSCVEFVFERTVFRPAIRRALPRSLIQEVRCALGSPWMRLAWLLTLQQQRTDLALLKDVADIEGGNEPCPGSQKALRSWYSLRDSGGLFVRDFHLCHADVRKIERLLPTLSGFFVRLPNRVSYEKRMCAIRQDGNRFPTYINALISAHETAVASRKAPDPMTMIDLIERKTQLRECTRDNMLIGDLWHFIPAIPSFTVCEDCYDSIIEPEVRKNADVALRFNRTVQPVYAEGMGSSCQLYSRRMQKVFRRAVEENDLKYLVRKAEERREAELRLQERYKDVVRRAGRASREGSGSEDEEARFNKELQRITDEWQAKWE